MRKPGSEFLGFVFLAYLSGGATNLGAASEEHHKQPARQNATRRTVEVRQTPGEVQRTVESVRPGGASVTRSVDINRAAGSVQADTRIVGPRGNTRERRVAVERTPFGVEREISIQRPGGSTLERSVVVERDPFPEPMNYGPAWGMGGPPVAPRSTSFGFFFGAPAPPPIVAPVVIGAPLVEVVQPAPVVIAPAPYVVVTPTPVIDPVNDEITHLSSFHAKSRRDACRYLGRLGDPRAVLPLMERLKFDKDTEVRQTAAWALGEIGDPRAAVYLQRASVYDKKDHVRDEAKKAMARLEVARTTELQVANAKMTGDGVPTTASPRGQIRTKLDPSTPPPPAPAPAPETSASTRPITRTKAPWPPATVTMPPRNSQTPNSGPSREATSTPSELSAPPASTESNPFADPLPPLEPPR